MNDRKMIKCQLKAESNVETGIVVFILFCLLTAFYIASLNSMKHVESTSCAQSLVGS